MSEKQLETPEEPQENSEQQEVTQEAPKETPKAPSLFHNYISFAGMAVVFASLASIIFLFLIEITGETHQPYLELFTYVLLPGILVFGLFIGLVGVLFERRRRRKITPEQIAAFPILDFNNPSRRRAFLIFLCCAFIFLFISAFGSYRAFEYSESVTFCGQTCHTVMKPEFIAHKAAPHSQIRCVDCHVGGGAEWYVRAKFNGIRQLYAVTFNTFHRPIKTPVHNMRSANETCANCHSAEKFHGDQLKVFNHYGYDENNSLNQTRMLIKVGGGSPETGQVSGIHWHMNLGNEVTFIASDEQRQNIPWVRMKDRNGNIVEYMTKGAGLTPQ
ncbi:MAG TPA: NapC/NirT family cytochrome c, partial [Pyrinomonadaceae bacterium]|nr:NapC/NirT family cytochrome c [Pyrinomonadaceae bacterium]